MSVNVQRNPNVLLQKNVEDVQLAMYILLTGTSIGGNCTAGNACGLGTTCDTAIHLCRRQRLWFGYNV